MKALTCTHDGVTVILKGDDSRIDSRIVARLLGLQHASFIRTLEQHQDELAECGIFRFQIGKISGRGRPEKYAMLNEDQFVFSITLSRNTPRVVQAKKAVVLAFGQARRLLAAQGHYLPTTPCTLPRNHCKRRHRRGEAAPPPMHRTSTSNG